jgi:hypothetical protein
MLTIHRPGLGDVTPFDAIRRYDHVPAAAVLTTSVPSLPPAFTPTADPAAGASWGHAPPAAAVVPGSVPAQEGRPAPAATQPTATVTSPTGTTEAFPVTLPAEPEVAVAPKRWPWIVGGIAAAGALILGTRLLRR